MAALFNVAGGLRYHARGWRNAEGRWLPFRQALGGWLRQWQPGGQKLVIVGPSGGYCLERAWLGSFEEIACLDPDPLARAIFTRRLRAVAPDTRVSWSLDDFLSERVPELQIRRFEKFLEAHPGAPVLFSNFLGQLSLLLQSRPGDASKAMAAWKSQLVRKTLEGRSWASFHDRVSGKLAPRFEQPYLSPARLTDGEIVAKLYTDPQGEVELADHETDGLFPAAREHSYFRWDLTREWIHLIEATRSN